MENSLIIWRPIKGYEGIYEVSNNGEVRSIDRMVKLRGNILRFAKGRNIIPNIRNKYLCVSLCANGIKKHMTIHRLVATEFIVNKYNKPEINHKNGIKTDNRAENLEWMTHHENVIHAYSTGLVTIEGIRKYNYKIRLLKQK